MLAIFRSSRGENGKRAYRKRGLSIANADARTVVRGGGEIESRIVL